MAVFVRMPNVSGEAVQCIEEACLIVCLLAEGWVRGGDVACHESFSGFLKRRGRTAFSLVGFGLLPFGDSSV